MIFVESALFLPSAEGSCGPISSIRFSLATLFRGSVHHEISRERFVKMTPGVSAFADAMAAVGIGQHGKLLVVRDKFVDQCLDPEVMAIIVASAVNDKQVAFQLMGVVDR